MGRQIGVYYNRMAWYTVSLSFCQMSCLDFLAGTIGMNVCENLSSASENCLMAILRRLLRIEICLRGYWYAAVETIYSSFHKK